MYVTNVLEQDNLKRFALSDDIGFPPLALLSPRPCCLTSRKHASGRGKMVQDSTRRCNMTSNTFRE